MSWQPVRGWYEFPDGDDLPELCEVICHECGQLFATPTDGPERFCSMACENRWCWRKAAGATN